MSRTFDRHYRLGVVGTKAPLILASLFFLLGACLHSCEALGQTIPAAPGSKIHKPRLTDDEALQIIVTDKDGYWVDDETQRACLVLEDVAKGAVEKRKACEAEKRKEPSSKLPAYAVGWLAGALSALVFVMAVQR